MNMFEIKNESILGIPVMITYSGDNLVSAIFVVDGKNYGVSISKEEASDSILESEINNNAIIQIHSTEHKFPSQRMMVNIEKIKQDWPYGIMKYIVTNLIEYLLSNTLSKTDAMIIYNIEKFAIVNISDDGARIIYKPKKLKNFGIIEIDTRSGRNIRVLGTLDFWSTIIPGENLSNSDLLVFTDNKKYAMMFFGKRRMRMYRLKSVSHEITNEIMRQVIKNQT